MVKAGGYYIVVSAPPAQRRAKVRSWTYDLANLYLSSLGYRIGWLGAYIMGASLNNLLLILYLESCLAWGIY